MATIMLRAIDQPAQHLPKFIVEHYSDYPETRA
jgi:hypothetical protein